MIIEKVLKNHPQLTNNELFFNHLKNLVQKTTQSIFGQINITKEELFEVFNHIIQTNQQKIDNLIKEYNATKGKNKYNDDGIWMDIGGYQNINKILSEISI